MMSSTYDGFTSAAGVAYMAMTGAFIDNDWELQTVLLAFVELHGSHTGENLADAMYNVIKQFKIREKVSVHSLLLLSESRELINMVQLLVATGDNLTTNNKAMRLLEPRLRPYQPGFKWKERRGQYVYMTSTIIKLLISMRIAARVMWSALSRARSSLRSVRL
jgi:hypothetical protein